MGLRVVLRRGSQDLGVAFVDSVRLLTGAHALLASRSAARSAFGPAAGSGARATIRVLGTRQVLQSLVAARTGWRALSAGVDVLHAASMAVPLAVAPRRLGRFALTQIATAAVLAALELAADRRA